MADKKKIVLAYSGGLDTTVIIPWLKENYDCSVIAVCADVGQKDDFEAMKKRALSTGADNCIVLDLKKEFVEGFLWPAIKASAVYESRYLLGTSIARPLIARKVVEIALTEKAWAVCHGCTGKGNDQVRFELTIKAFAPEMPIIAPWRIWDMQSREDEIAYLEARNIPVPMKKSDSYSRDENLWHISHEGLDLENPANEPKYDTLLKLSVTPEAAPDHEEYVELSFERGVPVALNGKKASALDLVLALNAIGGKNGIGTIDLVENRVVGMKSRGVYETPGGTIIHFAHEQLEHLCLDRPTWCFKQQVALQFADILYNGTWYTPLREALSAFVDATQRAITGTVRVKLYKGNLIAAGVESPYSLYNASIASFATGEIYSHKDAEGFINLFGLPIKVRALMERSLKESGRESVFAGGRD
jgi:argininosuccinate synthase